MKVVLRSNLADVSVRLSGLAKQLPYATAVALTRSAKDGQAAIVKAMGQVFDRPTPYALRGTVTKPATRDRLEARVWVKDNPFGKGVPADRFLGPQIFGGQRKLKGFERALQAAGLMPAGRYAVPAAGAQLDSYGNVKRSQITQILSQLQVQTRAGFESRRSASTASRRTVARQGVTYFALPVARRGLKPGIYLKRQFAQGSAIRPVFLFVTQVAYRSRLKFFEIGIGAGRAAYPRHFEAEWAKAVATARLRR